MSFNSPLVDSEDGWLRTLVEHISDVAVLVDADGRFHYATPSIRSIAGRSAEEMVGASLWDYVHPEDASHLKERIASRLRGEGDPEQYTEIRFRHRGLGWRVLQVRGARYEAPTGESGVVTVARDVTEQRTAEVALQDRERRFRALVENAADMVAVLNPTGVVRYVSPSVRGVLGFAPEEMVGRDPFELVHPEDRAKTRGVFEKVLENHDELLKVEYRIRHKDGSWRRVESRGSNLLSDPAVNGVVVNSRDVTEARSLEERLRWSQRLEAVGRLAGGIAHAFNNLLTVVRGNSTLLLSELEDSQGMRQEVEEMRIAAERGAALVRELLQFSSRHAAEVQSIDVGRVVETVVERLDQGVGDRIELQALTSEDPLTVEADAVFLEQVLTELVVNAQAAMSGGGEITISTGAADIADSDAARWGGVVSPGAYVRIEVRDTGSGMDQDTLERIFDPFFVKDRQTEGSGLGLSTAYGIIRQFGGHIRADSEVGKGSRFQIFLPQGPEGPRAGPESQPPPETP